jgi:hypothetical protein
MALTRPKLSQLDSSSTVFTDPLLVLHQGATAANIDVGFLFNRANGLVSNVALYWNETDKAFYTTYTNSGGATDANLVPTTYANLVTNVLSANTISVPSFTTTGNITGGNLITTGTVTVDRLSLSSSQTTVPPLQLTASSLQDGVGALRIDGSQADIFLNPATATHTTVTFAVNNDQRLAFGMDNNSDFYITRRTGGSWYDDTLVIDRDSGQVALGYDLLVSGDATVSGNLTVNGTTTTVSTTNTVVSDSLMELNTGAGSNANDLGFIFERGSTGDNAAIIWDESADAFVLGTTTATGASTGDLTVTAGALSIGSLTLGGTAVTSTAAELNLLDGVTATTAEINYLDGVTSAIQTQIDNISSDFYIAADNGSNDTFTTGQTLTFTGNTGIDTTVANNQVFIAPDIGVIATLTDAQTLTNKTITSPTINTPSISGNITLAGNVLPNLNEVYSLGTADNRFATLFVANSTIYLGDSALSLIGGTLYVDGTPVTGAGDAWPGYNGDYDLAKALAQTDSETPFEAGGTDAFGVSTSLVFDNMEPAGSTVTFDYADSYSNGIKDNSAEAYLGA